MIGGRSSSTSGSSFAPAQDERPHDRAQPLERLGVVVDLDRLDERAVEPLARAEQARVEQIHDRPQLAEVVLDRRARHRDAAARAQQPQRARATRLRVLHVLRLVEEQAVPVDELQRLDVARRDVVRRDHDVGRPCALDERLAREPIGAVVEVHVQRRREALDLVHPLARDAHRADDERRAERTGAVLLALGDDHRDRLHRLPETHVVGEHAADPEVAEQPQPAVARLLERVELVLHRRRRRQRLEARVPVEHPGEPLVERHLAEHEPVLVDREPRRGADEIDQVAAGAPLLEEAERALDVVAAQHLPPAFGMHERRALGREPPQLGLVEPEVADAQLPVEMREETGRRACAQVGADPRRL